MEVGGRYNCWTRTFIQACLILSRFSMFYFSCFSSFPRQLLLDWWQVVMEGSGR